MQFNPASRISFNITTNINDKARLDERLSEIHEFLNSQNVYAPVSHMDPETKGCVIQFKFGTLDDQIPMKAIIEPRTKQERFKVSVQTDDTSLNLTNYCRERLGKDATFMFREMVNHLLKVSTQKPHAQTMPNGPEHMPEPASSGRMELSSNERLPQTEVNGVLADVAESTTTLTD